jgi:hypothetical protein
MAVRRNKERTKEPAMHVCPRCDGPFVQPAGWSEAGPESWNVNLVCPNCDWSGAGVYSDDAVEQFDRELDRGAEEILADLEKLSRATMTEYIDRFTAALHSDQLLPEDF